MPEFAEIQLPSSELEKRIKTHLRPLNGNPDSWIVLLSLELPAVDSNHWSCWPELSDGAGSLHAECPRFILERKGLSLEFPLPETHGSSWLASSCGIQFLCLMCCTWISPPPSFQFQSLVTFLATFQVPAQIKALAASNSLPYAILTVTNKIYTWQKHASQLQFLQPIRLCSGDAFDFPRKLLFLFFSRSIPRCRKKTPERSCAGEEDKKTRGISFSLVTLERDVCLLLVHVCDVFHHLILGFAGQSKHGIRLLAKTPIVM